MSALMYVVPFFRNPESILNQFVSYLCGFSYFPHTIDPHTREHCHPNTGPDGWVQAPSVGNAELFVATRLKDMRNGSKYYAYVQDPERYTVGISFATHAPHLQHSTGLEKYSKGINQLQTRLLDIDGEIPPSHCLAMLCDPEMAIAEAKASQDHHSHQVQQKCSRMFLSLLRVAGWNWLQ